MATTTTVAAISADGTSAEYTIVGPILVQVAGSGFGGGTLAVEVSLDDGTNWAAEKSLSANETFLLDHPRNTKALIRFVVSGSTTPNILIFFQ